MAPSVPLVAALFRLSNADSRDESSLLQMPIAGKTVETDASDCACPGYYEEQCTDNAFQGCIWTSDNLGRHSLGWTDEGLSDAPWCQCDPDFVPTLPLHTNGSPPAPPPAPPVPEPVIDDEAWCAAQCQAAGHCCNDPSTGSNQQISCAQACVMRASGQRMDAMLTANDGICTRGGNSGCSLEVQGRSYSFCQSCQDLQEHCPHGVQSSDECDFGASLLPPSAVVDPAPVQPPPAPPPAPVESPHYYVVNSWPEHAWGAWDADERESPIEKCVARDLAEDPDGSGYMFTSCCTLEGTGMSRDCGTTRNTNFETARTQCASQGGRLCTAEEAMSQETVSQGCSVDGPSSANGGDLNRLWTSTPCTPAIVEPTPARNCWEHLQHDPAAQNGIYTLTNGDSQFNAYCDMANGGWTLVHNVPGSIQQNDYVTTEARPSDFSPASASPEKLAGGSYFKFSDEDVNSIAGDDHYFKWNCGNADVRGLYREAGWTSLRDQGQWEMDRDFDGLSDCTANRPNYIFADYPGSGGVTALSSDDSECRNPQGCNPSAECGSPGHVNYGEGSSQGGCYFTGSGWGTNAQVWARGALVVSESTHYYVVNSWPEHAWGAWDADARESPIEKCLAKDVTADADGSGYIFTSCCTLGGAGMSRDCGTTRNTDFVTAVAQCASQGGRLCTAQEAMSQETVSQGCSVDGPSSATGADLNRLWTSTPCTPVVAEPEASRNCWEHLQNDPAAQNGIYTMTVGDSQLNAYCDMANGGWTLVHNVPGTIQQNEYVTAEARPSDFAPATASSDLLAGGSYFKFSDADINSMAGDDHYFKWNCGNADLRGLYREAGWTSLRDQGQWEMDRDFDGLSDCTANRPNYIFADYPGSGGVTALSSGDSECMNPAGCNPSAQCGSPGHVNYGEGSGQGGCYFTGSGWGTNAQVWLRGSAMEQVLH